jgi:hypothetical protein
MPGDADARYLATIADDCLAILGEGFEIDDLIWDHDLGTRLTLRYRFGGREAETTATGDTVIEAHGALRRQLVVDRVRLTFTALVAPPPEQPPAPRDASTR